MVIKAVIGANYGDEGKGLMTDYFCHKSYLNGEKCLNVLTNGGAQRGHTVNHDGKHHVFHHFGSGTFSNADTYIHNSFIVNPIVFVEEYEKLKKFSISPTVYVNEFCRVTTPYDMMYNQILLQNSGKHNSCGMGVWDTITRYRDFNKTNKNCYLRDFALLNNLEIWNILIKIREFYDNKLKENNIELTGSLKADFYSDSIINHFLDDLAYMREYIKPVMFINDIKDFDDYGTIVLENAQGLLLDKNFDKTNGTPSHTGVAGFYELLNYISDFVSYPDIELCYVSRSYLTRHGDGDLPNECCPEEISKRICEKTNLYNKFQGNFRYAKPNLWGLVGRVQSDSEKCILPHKTSIALTHLDEYPVEVIKYLKYKSFGSTLNDIVEVL